MIRTEADPYYPGVDALIVGTAKDGEAAGTVAFPDSARSEAVRGRELQVTARVLSIQSIEVPELSDDLAGQLGYEGGIEGMRAALRQQIRDARENLARNQARANLLQALINANPFEVPSGMVDQHLEMLMEELRLQQAYRGRDPRSVRFSPEQVADLRVRAEFAAKGGIILEYVSRTEKLEVVDADLEAKYSELADQRGQTVEAIRGYFVKDGAVEELRSRLLEEKTLDWLLERAKISSSGAEAASAG
jgi:trigger factor